MNARVRLADRPGDVGEVVALHGRVYANEYGLDVTTLRDPDVMSQLQGKIKERQDEDA